MRLCLLGPLTWVGDDGAATQVGSGQQRKVLALLGLNHGHRVGRERLVDVLWGDQPPASADAAVQVYVSSLRKALGKDAIGTAADGGYSLGTHVEVDTVLFEGHAESGLAELAAGRLDAARARLDEALAGWGGDPYLDLAEHDDARFEAVRLVELHRAARAGLVDAKMRLGQVAGLAAELEAAVAEDPLWERAVEQWMTVLYLDGRQDEALRVGRALRRRLDDLGLEPTEELGRLEGDILNHRVQLVAADRARGVRGVEAPRGPMFGRDAELAQLLALTQSDPPQLVSLLGPGGSGKTRLATECALRSAAAHAGGVEFLDLSATRTGSGVVDELLERLGVEERGQDPVAALGAALSVRDMLLVLDNLEQVEDLPPVLTALRTAAPGARLLCTSRRPTGVVDEVVVALESLELPPEGSALAEIAGSAAVQLFVSSARGLRPDFALTADNAATVAQVCRRLEGLPLALELVAAQTRLLSLEELAPRLDGRLLAMSGAALGRGGVRQRTLDSTIAWSLEQLSPAARELFVVLGAFAGGATVEDLEAVAQVEDLDSLAQLVDNHLVRRVADRLRLLEPIRLFAAQQLAASPQKSEIRQRHAAHYAASPDPAPGEAENLRVALSWALDHRGDLVTRLGLRLAAELVAVSRFRETDEILTRLLEQPVDDAARVRILLARQDARFRRGRHEESRADTQAALLLAEQTDDAWGVARAAHALGYRAMQEGRLDEARTLCASGSQAAELAGDRELVTYFLDLLGSISSECGDLDDAARIYREAAGRSLESGNTSGAAITLVNLTEVLLRQGELDLAREQLVAVEELVRGLPREDIQADHLEISGLVELRRDEARAAAHHFERALLLRRSYGAEVGWDLSLTGLAAALGALGEWADAAALLGAVQRFSRLGGESFRGPSLLREPLLAATAAAAERALGRAYAGAVSRWEVYPLQMVVEAALSAVRNAAGAPPGHDEGRHPRGGTGLSSGAASR